ncbi:hypothetical protein [Lysinibacillus sphaericus]|uniref:hypothetical protein n=1 Tax=Lysinibacillus sphaericus TaxID=1421 RepID=UPI000C1783FD|nr:hypothetical protein [Lysinibacillus sphaericus]PIJ96851.1 hypothetical protein CTN02_15670 [Lysinibacillus sphaericus]
MEDIVFIEANGWRILSVPFLIMFSLFIIALIMKKSNEEVVDSEKKEKTLTSWVTKKDILYWLLIMCLGTISIFTFQYSGDRDVISHWGFAGTIVSIILAVVAIGFTLFQTLSSDLSSSKITESAEIISRVSAELNSSDLAKAGVIINKAAQDILNYQTLLETGLTGVHTEIDHLKSHTSDNFEKVMKSISSKSSFMSNNMGKVDGDAFEININIFFKEIYPGLPNIPRMYIYAILYLLYKDPELQEYPDLDHFLSELINSIRKDADTSDDYVNGFWYGISFSTYRSCSQWLQQFNIQKSFKSLDNESQETLLDEIQEYITFKESLMYIESYLDN